MAKEKFLLVSLKESKAKKLAQVMANETSRKILDYLAEKEATESELAEKLEVPISTIHYNLQQLMDAGIVNVEEFHYSEKGKEVNHYKLANKYIIIAPKGTWGIKEKLKSILPVVLIAIAGAGIIQLIANSRLGTFSAVKTTASRAVMEAAPLVEDAVQKTAEPAITPFIQTSFALWFLYGALFTIAIYLVWDWIRKR